MNLPCVFSNVLPFCPQNRSMLM